MDKKGIILLAHGSRLEQANSEVENLSALLKNYMQETSISFLIPAFLQFGSPSLEEALEQSVEQECEEVHIFPLFLTPGVHIQEDIPEIISRVQSKYLRVKFVQCRPLGCDKSLLPIIRDRIAENL